MKIYLINLTLLLFQIKSLDARQANCRVPCGCWIRSRALEAASQNVVYERAKVVFWPQFYAQKGLILATPKSEGEERERGCEKQSI